MQEGHPRATFVTPRRRALCRQEPTSSVPRRPVSSSTTSPLWTTARRPVQARLPILHLPRPQTTTLPPPPRAWQLSRLKTTSLPPDSPWRVPTRSVMRSTSWRSNRRVERTQTRPHASRPRPYPSSPHSPIHSTLSCRFAQTRLLRPHPRSHHPRQVPCSCRRPPPPRRAHRSSEPLSCQLQPRPDHPSLLRRSSIRA